MTMRVALTVLVIATSARVELAAQVLSRERLAALAGVVHDQNQRPIAHAVVLVEGSGRSAVTDADGAFHLDSLPATEIRATVMRLGFRPITFETALLPDTTLMLRVSLRSITYLEAIEVSAARVAEGLKRVGFYERQRRAFGSFVTPDRIDSLKVGARASQLLRDVRGIEVVCRQGATCTVQTRLPPHCLWLIVDGHYTNTQIDEFLTPDAIAAIEVYDKPQHVPIEFQPPLPPKRSVLTQNAGCGALVVWTVTRAKLDPARN